MMQRFLIALQFLTILPVGPKTEIRKQDFGKALLYFPVAGLLIGILLAISVFVFSFLPAMVRAALILIVSIVITGGLHLDGFADTCDSFYGNKPKEQVLQIMRDSHIGTMGVTGAILILLLKFSLLTNIPQNLLWKALILTAIFSRWSQVLACFSSSYARQEGKAKYFIEYAAKYELYAGLIFTLALFFLFLKLKGIILFFLALIPVFISLQYMKKRIGGMTGDTIGALSEIAEAIVLLFSLALFGASI